MVAAPIGSLVICLVLPVCCALDVGLADEPARAATASYAAAPPSTGPVERTPVAAAACEAAGDGTCWWPRRRALDVARRRHVGCPGTARATVPILDVTGW